MGQRNNFFLSFLSFCSFFSFLSFLPPFFFFLFFSFFLSSLPPSLPPFLPSFLSEKETSICQSTYLRIHWLILVCALTRDQTCNLGVSGQHSNQLSYQARARRDFLCLGRFKPCIWCLSSPKDRDRARSRFFDPHPPGYFHLQELLWPRPVCLLTTSPSSVSCSEPESDPSATPQQAGDTGERDKAGGRRKKLSGWNLRSTDARLY